jgi:peptidoglycan/LPS O-acetylase OafA/YrhL
MQRFATLDGLRGSLALIVVFDHALGMATISRDAGLTTRAATVFFSDMGGLAVLCSSRCRHTY